MTTIIIGWLIASGLSALAIAVTVYLEGNRPMNDLKIRKVNSDLKWLLDQCQARIVLAFGEQPAETVPLSVLYDEDGDVAPWIVRIGHVQGKCLEYPGSSACAAYAFFVATGIPRLRDRFTVLKWIQLENEEKQS